VQVLRTVRASLRSTFARGTLHTRGILPDSLLDSLSISKRARWFHEAMGFHHETGQVKHFQGENTILPEARYRTRLRLPRLPAHPMITISLLLFLLSARDA
jgi:hypothetical protein